MLVTIVSKLIFDSRLKSVFKRVFFFSSIESIELKVSIICNVFQCSEKNVVWDTT